MFNITQQYLFSFTVYLYGFLEIIYRPIAVAETHRTQIRIFLNADCRPKIYFCLHEQTKLKI